MAETLLMMVFAYDVQDNRVRRRVADLLERRAVRVQKSVFEVRMTRRSAKFLFDRLSSLLDDGDSLRMYALTRSAVLKSRAHGGAPLPEDEPFLLV